MTNSRIRRWDVGVLSIHKNILMLKPLGKLPKLERIKRRQVESIVDDVGKGQGVFNL